MTKPIDVQNAQVSTVAVEVKTLTIGRKQMTLAVFRQLPISSVIDRDSRELRGIVWGYVNYFFGDCKEGNHLHIVWQNGSLLYRDCVKYPPISFGQCWRNGGDPGFVTRQEIQAEQNEDFGHLVRCQLLEGVPVKVYRDSYGIASIAGEFLGADYRVNHHITLSAANVLLDSAKSDEEKAATRKRLRDYMLAEETSGDITLASAEQWLTEKMTPAKEHYDRWCESFKACIQSPQLFIAV